MTQSMCGWITRQKKGEMRPEVAKHRTKTQRQSIPELPFRDHDPCYFKAPTKTGEEKVTRLTFTKSKTVYTLNGDTQKKKHPIMEFSTQWAISHTENANKALFEVLHLHYKWGEPNLRNKCGGKRQMPTFCFPSIRRVPMLLRTKNTTPAPIPPRTIFRFWFWSWKDGIIELCMSVAQRGMRTSPTEQPQMVF